MLRYYRVAITRIANQQVLEPVFTVPDGETYKVVSVWPEFLADTIVRGWVAQDMVLDFHMEADAVLNQPIPMDLELGGGKTFSIGFLDETGGGAVQDVNVGVETP